jgi:diguanylate cyclase (GGDEF)-like protein
MVLDQATLFAVATSITGLLGVFLLVLWRQERGTRAMAWWGGAYLMGAFAVTLWGQGGGDAPPAPALPLPEMANAFLFLACGMIWNGARLFHGRRVLPAPLCAGALTWFVAMQFDELAKSGDARLALSSVVIAVYAFLAAFELRRERRRGLATRFAWIGVPLLHGAVFLAPLALILLHPAGISAEGLFAVFAFQTVIYVVGTAFVVVVMAKERVAQAHKTAAMTDLLTGLFNRRAFVEAANAMIEQRARKSQPVSVLLFDLDKFKSINDRFGHAVGDDALKVFAATASSNIRSTDVIGRLGGEEFAAIIPGNAEEAGLVAQRLRTAFQAAGVVIAGHEMGATVSVGVATATAPALLDPLLARADAALYRAKHNGRNRVEFDQPEPNHAPAPHPNPALDQALPALRQTVSAA